MTTKHTPAPWIAYKRADTMFDIQTAEYIDEYNEEVSDVICESVCFPNVKLIAAAPDLLEALIDVLDAFERHSAGYSKGYEFNAIVCAQARAAIAKATQ